MPPLVSVLTTVYNREPYLAACIESVLAQNMPDFELIIVDDCSTDGSYAVAERYLSDPRVRLFRNEANLGDYPNRNRAASLARGTYLKYVDGDDLIYPHCLELMVEGMQAFPEAGYGLSREFPRAMAPVLLSPEEAYRDHYFGTGLFASGPLDAIIRREAFEAVGGFSPARYTSDTDFFLRLGARYPGVILVPGLVWWRHHADQESAIERTSIDRVMEVTFRRHRSVCDALKDPACPLPTDEIRKLRNRSIRQMQRIALGHLRQGRWRWAVRTLREVQLADPTAYEQDVGSGRPHPAELLSRTPMLARPRIKQCQNTKIVNALKHGAGSFNPQFSILIPARNSEATIGCAIQSIIEQQYNNWELIIVDDASDDNTYEEACRFQADKRVRCFKNTNILGKWENHNQAASLAKGKYLKFCHADDALYPNNLILTAELLENAGDIVQAVSVGAISTHPGTALSPRATWEHEFLNGSILMEGPTAMVYRRDRFTSAFGYDSTKQPPDRHLALRLATEGATLILPPRLYWSPRNYGNRPRMSHAYPGGELEGTEWLLSLIDEPNCPLSLSDQKKLHVYIKTYSWLLVFRNLSRLPMCRIPNALNTLFRTFPKPFNERKPYQPLYIRRQAYQDCKTPDWIKHKIMTP